MSSDSRRTSRCFSWMSLNQSTSMSSSRPSGSQMPTEARLGSSSRPQRNHEGSRHPKSHPPGPPSSSRTIHATTQFLLQQNPTEFQGIQLALNGVHLLVDVLLGDVLVSLDLPDSTLVTWRTAHPSRLPHHSPASTGRHRPRAWALSHPPSRPDAGPRVGKGWCGYRHNAPMLLAPAPTGTLREAQLPASLGNSARFSATP